MALDYDPDVSARIVRQQGRRAISVDDVVQSIEVIPDRETPGYWPAMLPTRECRRALLLGFGGGTVARLLLDAHPEATLLAVDDDAETLRLVAAHDRFRIESDRLAIVERDAFDLVRDLEQAGERFDYIAVDLYRGAEMVRASLARPFLRRLGDLLLPAGQVVFNFPRDRRASRRIRRLGQYFRIERTTLVGLNCLVHCAPYAG